jgi:hypothetical protein
MCRRSTSGSCSILKREYRFGISQMGYRFHYEISILKSDFSTLDALLGSSYRAYGPSH